MAQGLAHNDPMPIVIEAKDGVKKRSSHKKENGDDDFFEDADWLLFDLVRWSARLLLI